MRVLKWVLALGLPLLAGAAGTAAAAGFPGTYRNDTVTVEINEEKPGEYFGVFLEGNDVFEFSARRAGDALVGSYPAAGGVTPLRMSLRGTALLVSEGRKPAYTLARQADPGGPPPPAVSAPTASASPSARPTPPPPTAAVLRVNRSAIPEATVKAFEQVHGLRLPRGDYWYDRVSGAWGPEGGPTAGFTAPGMNLGGPLPADASRGNTGVFINGRELPMQDVAGLMQMKVPVQQGRWWVDNAGNFGIEGLPAAMGNLFQYSRGRGGAYQRATAGGYIGGDGQTSYFFDPQSGSSVMIGE